jgi:hypothetical protein
MINRYCSIRSIFGLGGAASDVGWCHLSSAVNSLPDAGWLMFLREKIQISRVPSSNVERKISHYLRTSSTVMTRNFKFELNCPFDGF